MTNRTCTIEGCDKPTRSKLADWCKMHYHRWYRTGDPGDARERKRKYRNPHCSIEGCLKPDTESGLCSAHAARKRRHGDPLTIILPSQRSMPTGEAHHAWRGEEVGYWAAHTRIKRSRGPASNLNCVDCGLNARHWSYNHDDPDEQYETAITSNPIAYSAKPEHYSPRCVSCHKVFDLGRVDAV